MRPVGKLSEDSKYRYPVLRHEKARLFDKSSRGAGRLIGLYTTLVVVVIVVVAVIVSPAVFSPVGDIVAESVFDPVWIICHIDHSVRLLPDVLSIGFRLEDTPPAGNPSSAFSIFLGILSISPLCRIYGFDVLCVHLRCELIIYQLKAFHPIRVYRAKVWRQK